MSFYYRGAQIETNAWPFINMADPFNIAHIGVPQAPTYKLCPDKQVKPSG